MYACATPFADSADLEELFRCFIERSSWASTQKEQAEQLLTLEFMKNLEEIFPEPTGISLTDFYEQYVKYTFQKKLDVSKENSLVPQGYTDEEIIAKFFEFNKTLAKVLHSRPEIPAAAEVEESQIAETDERYLEFIRQAQAYFQGCYSLVAEGFLGKKENGIVSFFTPYLFAYFVSCAQLEELNNLNINDLGVNDDDLAAAGIEF